jgi:hypothetical protein
MPFPPCLHEKKHPRKRIQNLIWNLPGQKTLIDEEKRWRSQIKTGARYCAENRGQNTCVPPSKNGIHSYKQPQDVPRRHQFRNLASRRGSIQPHRHGANNQINCANHNGQL